MCTRDSPVFPDIKREILHGVSSFECNDMQISFSIYYLLLYGSTWYEDKSGAKFTDKTKRTNIAKFKSLLSLLGKAQKTTFGRQKPKKRLFVL